MFLRNIFGVNKLVKFNRRLKIISHKKQLKQFFESKHFIFLKKSRDL